MMTYQFIFNHRLGIDLPSLELEWTDYSKNTQESILAEWEKIRGHIPDRILELEKEINRNQSALNNEEDFEKSCNINSEIAELASIINDLWLWYRMNQTISRQRVHQ
jgi:hypothetical protein